MGNAKQKIVMGEFSSNFQTCAGGEVLLKKKKITLTQRGHATGAQDIRDQTPGKTNQEKKCEQIVSFREKRRKKRSSGTRGRDGMGGPRGKRSSERKQVLGHTKSGGVCYGTSRGSIS